MRFHKKSGAKPGESGVIKITAEDAEDMWALYNLIEVGDRVTASATRKVIRESASGASSSEKMRVNLTLVVISTAFDAETGIARVAGRNAEESAFVKMGAHHTLDLEPHRAVDVEKSEWRGAHLRLLHESSDTTRRVEVAAVVMDTGLAHVCLISDSLTLVRARIEMSIPKKRAGAASGGGGGGGGAGVGGGGAGSQHDKGVTRFFDAVALALARTIDMARIKAVIVASPGFVRDNFMRWLLAEAARRPELRALQEHRAKFVLARTSSGHAHALAAALMDPAVAARLASTRAAADVTALAAFFHALHATPERAFYGFRHTRLAADRGAVETLLLSDALFRCMDAAARADYDALSADVAAAGGAVRIFSSMHGSGEQLSQLSGVACLCRFPLPDAHDASALYAPAAAAHARALARMADAAAARRSEEGGGAGGGAAAADAASPAEHGGGAEAYNRALFDDSDDSSDSDASEKKR